MSASYGSEWASYMHIIYNQMQQKYTSLAYNRLMHFIFNESIEYIVIAHSKCIFKDTQTGFVRSVLDRGLVNYNLSFCT